MATNHIFIDYENMKSVPVALFTLEKATSITLFFGPQNRSLELPVVKQMMAGPRSVELIRIDKDGRDAVDFSLSYYLGRRAVLDPLAFFHVVSKDTGYDPLIEHLKRLSTKVRRYADYDSLLLALNPLPSAAGEPAAKPASRKVAKQK